MGKVYSHLPGEERQVIRVKVDNGTSIRGIGTMLGRSPSSTSREIERNTWFPSNENESYRPYRLKRLRAGPWIDRYYIARPAQRKTDHRRSKLRKPYRLSHDRLWAQVVEWLGRGWSPLLISNRLRVLWSDDALMRVCPETIYRWVYSSRPPRKRWVRCLSRGHRRRHRHGGRRTSRFPISDRVPIFEHPPETDGRSAFGHWEADSVIGMGCNLRTEVERRTRFLMTRIVPNKTTDESVGAQLDMLSPLPVGARISVTCDNNIELAHRERLRDGLSMATYFVDPYSSWQWGSNGSRNGMVRQYLLKHYEIRMDMMKEIKGIVNEINNRPIRMLGYRTPAEAFTDELLELQDQQGYYTSKWTSSAIRHLMIVPEGQIGRARPSILFPKSTPLTTLTQSLSLLLVLVQDEKIDSSVQTEGASEHYARRKAVERSIRQQLDDIEPRIRYPEEIRYIATNKEKTIHTYLEGLHKKALHVEQQRQTLLSQDARTISHVSQLNQQYEHLEVFIR